MAIPDLPQRQPQPVSSEFLFLSLSVSSLLSLILITFANHLISHTPPKMTSRVDQIAKHLNYPKGLLAGQVAIVTGSGQGIGAETARLFANEGAKVVVTDIDQGKPLILFE